MEGRCRRVPATDDVGNGGVMERFRVVYRALPGHPWESCYLVAGGRRGRERALESARQVAEQEVALGACGQVGIQPEEGGRVVVVRGRDGLRRTTSHG